MKIIISIFCFLTFPHAFAGDASSGCGLGWRVTKSMTTSGSSTRNLTNFTFSNTLAMTSGTSGCDFHSIVLQEKNKIHFVESNLVPLQYEIALGAGERLEAAHELFGCQSGDMDHFKSVMKKSSHAIFGIDRSPSHVLGRMEEVIHSDAKLTSSCLI